MQWLEDLQTRPFVGAESRLELIFRQLEEIVLFATPDAERRLAGLRAQQAALQAQIELVEATKTAETYTAVQLTERFANALDLARGLQGDFRQLEENFKELARALAEAQIRPGATKGGIVGQLLDTHAALKDSAQGQSFYAFWNLLSSPERQKRWRYLIRQAYQLDGIDDRLRANRLLERLSGCFHPRFFGDDFHSELRPAASPNLLRAWSDARTAFSIVCGCTGLAETLCLLSRHIL